MKGNPKLLLAFGKCFPATGPRREHVEILPQSSGFDPRLRGIRRTIRLPERIRWSGILKLAEVENVSHNVKTFRFRPPEGGGPIPFDYFPGNS